jgi:hypothetical protein
MFKIENFKDFLTEGKKMNKSIKILFPLLLIFCLMLGFTSAMSIAPGYDVLPIITSVNQYYSVVFDEEGEAIVSLNLKVQNMDSEDLSTLNLEIPGNNVQILGVMQESSGIGEQICASWTSGCTEYGQGNTCIRYDYNGNCVQNEQPCLKYGKTCNRYITNNNYQKSYKKIKVEPQRLASSYSVPITLNSPVKENGYTNILIVYKIHGYVNNFAGVHKFDFETAKLPLRTNIMRVAINVQNDLHLKGGTSQINYQHSLNVFAGASNDKAEMSMESSRQIDQYAQQITYARGLVKNTNYLDPHESFSVEGKYSKSWAKLNIGKIFLIIAIIVGIVCFLYYAGKKLSHYAKENAPKNIAKDHKTHNFMIPFLSGLFTSIGIALLWIVSIILIWVVDNLSRTGLDDVFALLIILFAILISLAFMIGVPIYTGTKYGGLIAFFTITSIFCWLFVFAIIIFFVLIIFASNGRYI